MGVQLEYEFKIEGEGDNTMGRMTLKNITMVKNTFFTKKGVEQKTFSGKVTLTPFVNPGDTIQLLFN